MTVTEVKGFGRQKGVFAAFAWAFVAGLVMFKLIDMTIGLRASPEEEAEGLDYGEHGANAYPDFQVATRVM
jgi:Amt family ammonium transporter